MFVAPRRVSVVRCAPRVLFALWAVASIAAGCRKQPTTFQLENGLRIELLPPSRGEKAAVALLLDVGADHDPPGRSGMAHLVERLLSTGGRPGRSQGLHARTDAAYTLYAVEVPARRLTEEIDDAALRLSRLTATENDLARERPRLLADLATAREGNATSAAMNQAAEAIRPSRGGGVRGGIAAELEKVTPEEVAVFLRANYGAANARLVIAGNYDAEDVAKRIRAAFGKVPAGKAPQARPPNASRVTGTLVMSEAPRAVALAVPVPDVKDPLYPAFLVLAARLVESSNQAKQSSTQSWKTDFAPLARPDLLFVTSAIADGQQAEAAAERMRAEVNAIVTAPPAADEPQRALARFGGLLGATPAPAEPAASPLHETAFAAGRRAQLGLDGPALARAIAATTPEQLAAAARLFDAKSSAAVIAGGKLP